MSVSLLMADAYARKGDTKNEFSTYDAVLLELASRAQNVPLGSTEQEYGSGRYYSTPAYDRTTSAYGADSDEVEDGQSPETLQQNAAAGRRVSQSFQLGSTPPSNQKTGARSPEYARILDRYLARLVQLKQTPAALAVLRHEIDRNPDDPGLYERLARFLDQNRLESQQEEVYRRAIARFPNKSWYDKLARFYLRHKRDSEFEQLTRDVVKTFQGSELEQYFNQVVGGSAGLYLRLNQYAHERFPHNPVFVHNLLNAYKSPGTYDLAAWEALLRQHWFEDLMLQNRFFEFLSARSKLDAELSALGQMAPDDEGWEKNPAAANFIANANLWRSHFEESAPVLKSLAAQYPAQTEIARTASSVYRSLAYFESADTAIANRIENNLLQANPTDTEIMARIGDIYADREQFAEAAPYWERIPQAAPGQSAGYLQAATIYWDYFDFEDALSMLAKGRERLANPTLYSYEAGAIHESQRDYSRAIEEYVKGALSGPDSSAELRLLQLARRPQFRDLVDQNTARAASEPNLSMSAAYLRVKVLETQNRKPELEAFLDSLCNRTTSMEQAEEIENLAQQKSLETVRQHALEKQAALTTDPITRLQLRYALIRLYESRKDFAAAQKNVESLYRENSKLLGVVRSTVDFYWRMKMQTQAIAVLLQAATDAYPALRLQFTYEAARKSTEARQFQSARDLLTGLMKDSPYNGEYLAAMADTFAQAGDYHGLEQFYLKEIALFRSATLPADTRKAQIATLRRGLIPSLTRMNNYAGAVDQYIELINNFPEDDALVTEAALYALRYQRQKQLVGFYEKTVVQSPRDYRWSMVLARTQTNLENYPAAIETYAKSIAIRPDRADLYIARAGLEERLMRFDEAATDYDHIYQLAYKDPQWMEKVAAVRARQGRVKETVTALQSALIDGRPENPDNYFEVSRRLESWGMFEQARTFAEQGVANAGPELLAAAEHHAGAKLYVRIMARLRQHDQAYTVLQKALDESSSKLPVLKEQLEKQGIASVTNTEWRENTRRIRIETARNGMAAALLEMGHTVDTYFTPEERLAFAHFAESKRSGMTLEDVETLAIPLAQSAALAEQEARWRYEALMQRAGVAKYYPNIQPFVDLQRRRGRFAELGEQMEQVARAMLSDGRVAPLLAAADAYRSAGDEANELRVRSMVFSMNVLDVSKHPRYFELLLKRQPQELVRIASSWPSSYSQQAADYVVANGSATLAHEIVQARSKARAAVWNKAYTALVGLYFAEPTAEVNRAFVAALGDDPIGARLGKPVDRTQQLAGNTWFYYGSRYGEYLGKTKLGKSEDFLPAILEENPASASAYLTVAEYYAGAGDSKHAIADYNLALELSPNRPDVYDNLAVSFYKQGDREGALAQWKRALAVLGTQLNTPHVPESFWADFGRTCDQLATRHLFGELKSDADAILRNYLRRNGNYRSNALLHSAYAALGDPASATAWLLDLSSVAHDPSVILADVVDGSWIPLAHRAPIYQRILDSKETSLSKLSGLERQYAEQDLGSWQVRWAQYLIRTKQYTAAASVIDALPDEIRQAQAGNLVPLDLQVAAQIGTLDSKLTAYRTESQNAPAPDNLRKAARVLFEAGDKQSARKIVELVFASEIEERRLIAANFLGLAEIRIASGDTAGAVELLRRLVVAVGNPFENLDPAAALLEKTGQNAEAIEFLDELVKSAPWEPSYRLRLAKAKLATDASPVEAHDELVSIASGTGVPYDLRVKAALTLSGRDHSDLGSGELNVLAGSAAAITVSVADRFYFYEARIIAAKNVADAQARTQLLSHCIIDFPRREDARLPLFKAATAVKSDEYALGVVEPLFNTQFLRNDTPGISKQDEEIINADEEDEGGISGSPTARRTRSQQAEAARMIADSMSRLDRFADALSYYQTARHLETSADVRKVLLRKIAGLKSVLRMQQQNAARQPLLHEALEQDRVVRPRLLTSTVPALKSAATGGAQ